MDAIYLNLPLMLLGIYLLIRCFPSYRIEKSFGTYKYRMKWLPAVLLAVPMIYYTWNRPIGFGDTHTYSLIFNGIPASLSQIGAYLAEKPDDPLFTVLICLVKSFQIDYRGFLLIVAFVQILSLVCIYRRYSGMYFLSLFLFLMSTDYYSWTWNGMRQFLAVTIIFAAASWFIEKKYVKAVLVILLASGFHSSAIMMLPVLFLVQGKPFNKRTLLVIFLSLGAIMMVDLFTDILDSSLQETQYSHVISDVQNNVVGDDNGTNPIRVLVYSVPTIIAMIGYRRIQWKNNPVINVCTNMSIISTCLYLISMVTSGIYLGRLPIYCSLYNYILLPWEIRNLFAERSQGFLLAMLLILYSGFYWYQMFVAW